MQRDEIFINLFHSHECCNSFSFDRKDFVCNFYDIDRLMIFPKIEPCGIALEILRRNAFHYIIYWCFPLVSESSPICLYQTIRNILYKWMKIYLCVFWNNTNSEIICGYGSVLWHKLISSFWMASKLLCCKSIGGKTGIPFFLQHLQ